MLRVDNGPELTAADFADWCREREIEIGHIQPGKPDQNAYIERFNRSLRDEVLDAWVFESIAEVRAVTEEWLEDYNRERPHDSLGRVPPLTSLPRHEPARKYTCRGSRVCGPKGASCGRARGDTW
jgi:putative transposase